MQKEQLINYINQFCLHVYEFERALAKNLETEHNFVYDSWSQKIPRTGTIEINAETWNYHFHGGGCRLAFKRIIVDYNYAGDYTIKLPLFYLEQFIKCFEPEFNGRKELMEELMVTLVEDGLLQKSIDGFEFDRKNLRF